MTIFLIRHTTPKNSKGLCYGFTNLEVDDNFDAEAETIKNKILQHPTCIYSSPLKRCSQLANYLFEEEDIQFNDALKEMNFGNWENKRWDDIDYKDSKYWMDNFVTAHTPNGESYEDLYNRAITCFNKHVNEHQQGFVWVTHSGVIRSILSFITHVKLEDSFKEFSISYGSVIKITCHNNKYTYEIA